MTEKFDIAIIGGGVVGTAIAREFSKYKVDVALFEKEPDVGFGASGSNSGVIHTGLLKCPVNSLKAEVGKASTKKIEDVCEKLDVPYDKVGKLVLAFSKEEIPELYEYEYRGTKNNAEVKIIGKKEIKELEPNLARGKAALYSPDSAIINPFEFTIALAENALQNNVDIYLNTKIEKIEKNNFMYTLNTSKDNYQARYVINSAGLWSDKLAEFSGEKDYKTYPCRGEYLVLDKRNFDLMTRLIYPLPRERKTGGGGIHLTPTVEGNILVGPSDEYIDKENVSTTKEVLEELISEGEKFIPEISKDDIINSFAGLRSKIVPPDVGGYTDFVIEESPKYETFINLLGIESPGLTSALGIAEYVQNLVDKKENLNKKRFFEPQRERIKKFSEVSTSKEKEALLEEKPDYGEMICRCEKVTKQELIEAINNPLGAQTIKSIRNRTRVTFGRCQGGYCLERIVEIMREEGIDISEITLKNKKSNLFTGPVKEVD